MSGSTFQQVSLSLQLIAKLALLWIALLILPFAERTLLGAKTYYFLYVGLGLVFVCITQLPCQAHGAIIQRELLDNVRTCVRAQRGLRFSIAALQRSCDASDPRALSSHAAQNAGAAEQENRTVAGRFALADRRTSPRRWQHADCHRSTPSRR